MKKIKDKLPIFWSPKFWGVVLFGVLGSLVDYGYINPEFGEAILVIVGLATGVGVLDSAAKKIGK